MVYRHIGQAHARHRPERVRAGPPGPRPGKLTGASHVDFGALPPEINSARMYSGPGSGPMLTAAAAWDALAGELRLEATGFGSVISGLTAQSWTGPASESMAASAARYTAW